MGINDLISFDSSPVVNTDQRGTFVAVRRIDGQKAGCTLLNYSDTLLHRLSFFFWSKSIYFHLLLLQPYLQMLEESWIHINLWLMGHRVLAHLFSFDTGVSFQTKQTRRTLQENSRWIRIQTKHKFESKGLKSSHHWSRRSIGAWRTWQTLFSLRKKAQFVHKNNQDILQYIEANQYLQLGQEYPEGLQDQACQEILEDQLDLSFLEVLPSQIHPWGQS